MNSTEKKIINALKTGNFRLSSHAAGRMKQRSVSKADIQACGKTASFCYYQDRQGTWRVDGEDLDKDRLTVTCGVDNNVVIVTIF